MPLLFDYECLVCAHIFEAFELRDQAATPHCPACFSKETERKFPVPKARNTKSPFDYLHSGPPEPKVFSGPHARSKG